MARHRQAFTLLELIIAIVIVALLAALVAVSLRAMRASAARTDSLDALRQMALAYSTYSTDHRQRLAPGYVADPGPLGLAPRLEDGTVLDGCAFTACDGSSYVWRLAPYVDHLWQVFYAGLETGVRSDAQRDFETGAYGPGSPGLIPGGLSERPAFGMNSIFVGGDDAHAAAAFFKAPWDPSADPDEIIAATRLSEVKYPTRLIVFGTAARASTAGDEVYDDIGLGFCELRPPYLDDRPGAYWTSQQWTIGSGSQMMAGSDADFAPPGAGLPVDRAGGQSIPVAHLDGSTVTTDLPELSRDMRRWDPFEVTQRPGN